MSKPLTSANGMIELACKRYCQENGIKMSCPLVTSEPSMYECNGKYVFFGNHLGRGGRAIAKENDVYFITSVEQFAKVIGGDLFQKGDERIFKCTCGKNIVIITNAYDKSNSGMGSCECGAVVYIN